MGDEILLRLEMDRAELETYRPGLNLPDDFAQFWQTVLAEPTSAPPRFAGYRPHAALPGVEIGTLSYEGVGGLRFHARVVRLAGRTQEGALVVRFPGYNAPPAAIVELLPWAAMGFTVVSVAVRGQPGGPADPGPYPDGQVTGGVFTRGLTDPWRSYYRYVYVDTVRAVQAATAVEGVDPGRVVVTGGSQGGGLSLIAAALSPPGSVQAALVSFPFPAHIGRAAALAELPPYTELVDRMRRLDPRGTETAAVDHTLALVDVLSHAPQVKVPVLMGIGLTDLICPPSASFAVLHHLDGPAESRVYPAHGHEELPGFMDDALAFACEVVRSRAPQDRA